MKTKQNSRNRLKFVKEKVNELSLLIKKHGYWSDEVNSFNNNLINDIGGGNLYWCIQEMAKNNK